MLTRRALLAVFAQQKRLVILLGDSIRMGYEPYVVKELSDAAEVWAPKENGAHTANLLVQLSTWVLPKNAAVIHVNAGLHDLKTIHYDTRENVVPLKHYRDNVETLLRTMHERTKAKLIWATTTMVNDAGSQKAREKNREFRRYHADVVAYNREAVKVCRKLGVPVNDLYALSQHNATQQMPDGVHFAPEGYRILGAQVATRIREAL